MLSATPALDPQQVRQWLELLHGKTPGRTHICATDNWTGRSFENLDHATDYVTQLDQEGREGIYARVTTLRAPLEDGRRGGAVDTAALPALWADLDLAGPGHAENNLPPDTDAGKQIIAISGLPQPTLWVHSGGGLYPLWMLEVPALIDEHDLDTLKALSTSWQRVIEHAAGMLGWHYGRGVGDLARVLRIPGTVNRKEGLARPCRILDQDGPRHTLEQLRAAAERAVAAIPAPTSAAPAPAGVMVTGPARERSDDDPGQDFNARGDWAQILEPAGWTLHNTVDGIGQWTRPGKTTGISATTNALGTDRLHIFSTAAAPFDANESYSKFGAWTLLYCGGDFKRAARELLAGGYGRPADHGAQQRADLEVILPGWRDQPASKVNSSTRPSLDVTNAAVAADWLRDHIGQGLLAGMFDRGGQIVHTPAEGEDGYQPTGNDRDHDGPAQVRSVTASTLASRIQYSYRCHRLNADGESKPAMFPTSAARVAVDVPDMLPHLRRLAGVTHTPLVRPDGTILTTAGYDQLTQLLYLPGPNLQVPPIPEKPTNQDVKEAVALLDQMVDGFPFVSDHDRANYYGLLLTPLLRLLCPPPYKLFAIGAPMPGSGKTLLATCARIIHDGIFRAEMPEDNAELRKAISTILDITTGPVVHFDNVTGCITSSVLAGLLTSGKWEDRRLGTMEQLTRPNDRVWTFTGNNLTFGGDLPRRTVWCTIDPQMPHPESRTEFAIHDLEKWVLSRRGELLAALLTIIRAWITSGRPTPPSTRSDGFSVWTNTTSAILIHAGVPGIFDHPDSTREGGTDDDGWGTFLSAVHHVFGDQEWTAVQVLERIDRIDTASIPIDALPGNLAERIGRGGDATRVARSLGMWLRNRVGRWADGLMVQIRGKNRANQQIWQIVPYDTPGARTARTARTNELRRARVEDKPDTSATTAETAIQAPPEGPRSPLVLAPSSCTACGQPLHPALAPQWLERKLHPSCTPNTEGANS